MVLIFSQMGRSDYEELSRRDRQVLDHLLDLRQATANDLVDSLGAQMSNSTIRTFLSRLEQHGFVRRSRSGRADVYRPTRKATRVVMDRLRDRLLSLCGSPARAAAVFLESGRGSLSGTDLDLLKDLVESLKEGKAENA